MIDLQDYMSGSIRNIMTKAYKNVLRNPREARFAFKMQQTFQKSEKQRRRLKETEDIDVPPFLISSISTSCNLSCAGCYARKNGIADDPGKSTRPTLSGEQWRKIFEEASSMGINFSLLAGGEPMMRRDILEQVAEVKDMIFPIFTNGTLIGPAYIQFLKQHLNMIPVISLEGYANVTDERRGKGVYQRVMHAMEELHAEDLFFGTSITVTMENLHQVTSDDFIEQLRSLGCKLIIYVEYVPTEPGTEHLAFTEKEIAEMEAVQDHQRERFDDVIVISFPGDEKHMGGCLAAGRGFFHIGPDGAAEPCPFSPYSDSNVVSLGVRGALKSPLFRKLRDIRLVGGDHDGGCALFEHRDEVEAISRANGNTAYGRIVNLCSSRYLMSEAGTEAYSASKGGIYSLTHALAISLAPYRVTVNAIAPGWIHVSEAEELRPADHAFHPSGRVGEPDDIARACLFLCDEKNDFINGQTLTIDGGVTRKMIYPE